MTIEGYRLEAQRGSGAGLMLWRARSVVSDVSVVLQIWESAEASVREAVRTLAAHRHPGLATVLDIGETTDGHLYVGLADLPGPSLAEQLRDGLDLPMALTSLRQLAAACAFLEQRSTLRAQLTPESILFDARQRPVLTQLKPSSSDEAPAVGLHALGRLIFEALCGEAPAETRVPPSLPDYLQRWQPLIDGCLGEGGFKNFAELLAALDALEGRSSSRASVQKPAVASDGGAEENSKPVAEAAAPPSKQPSPQAQSAPAAVSAAAPPGAPSRQVPAARLKSPPAPAQASASDGRVTAPSKRLDRDAIEASESARASSPTSPPLPPPPSRAPLYLAAAVALAAVLGGLGVWLRVPDSAPRTATPPAPEASSPERAEPRPEPARMSEPQPAVGFEALDQVSEYELNPALEVELDTLPTVVDPVAQFILFGNTNLAAGRLVEPPQRNALERYLLALRIEPSNREAQAGIAAVGDRCLQVGRSASTLDGLLAGLSCAERVASAHPAGQPAGRAAAELRQNALDDRLQAGQRALADWRSAQAVDQFEQALRIAPDSVVARTGLDEARRQGRPGYSFRDRLAGGGEGPELRVVGALGWGRHEISVAEFGRYWEDAGRAAFADRLPSCRDRESLLRSSRKRSWQSPDISQSSDHPVVCVNHAMAAAYVEWLSAQTSARYRLPSRAEWEAAAGAIPGDCAANFRDQAANAEWSAREAAACSDGHAYTAPVSVAGSQSGLLGLWGNVAEWLADCEGSSCRERLAAGGSWFTPPAEVGVRGFAAEPGFTTIGFRVVRDLPDRRE
jgi:serine/threonine-protein kinase PpkA